MFTDDEWGRSDPRSIINIADTVKGTRIQHVDEIKRALEIAEFIPFRYLVQHLGYQESEYDERKVDAAFSSLEELSLFARQRGVQVLLENIPNAFSSAERLVHFLGLTHLDLGFCLDTGHANLNEGVEEAYNLMKSRIRSTHVHDNDGTADKHLFPFHSEGGTIDWKRTMELLASAPEQYPLLLELKESPDYPRPLDAIRQIFDRLEKLAVEEPVR